MEKTRRKAYHQALDAGFASTEAVNANADAYRERLKRREHSTCPACGAHSDMGDNYCRMCGKSVTPTCRSCGQALPE